MSELETPQTPAPEPNGRAGPSGGEVNDRHTNGTTPKVVVTMKSVPRRLGSTATRLFSDPWKPTRILQQQALEFGNLKIWRKAILEGVFTGIWIFGSILVVSNSAEWGTTLRGRTILVAAALHVVLFFIYIQCALLWNSSQEDNLQAQFPNLNPATTVLMLLAGAKGLVESVLFIVFQFGGGVLAALAAKDLLPQDRMDIFLLGGCFGRRTIVGPGGVHIDIGLNDHKFFLAEFLFSFSFLYVTAITTTPRHLRMLGVTLAVFVISLNIGLQVYLSSAMRDSFSGSMFNPARCFGPAIAYGQPLWDRIWPSVLAPFVAAVAVAFLLGTLPPDHIEEYALKTDVISKVRRWGKGNGTRRGGDFEPGLGPLELEDGTIYQVPSAGRLFSASPETPGLRDVSETSDEV